MDCNNGRLANEPETETWVKYIDEDLKTRLIKSLLSTITYDEITVEQKKLVTEYETEIWKAKIDELTIIDRQTVTEEQIHDWWLDYKFTDGTEDNLVEYIKRQMKRKFQSEKQVFPVFLRSKNFLLPGLLSTPFFYFYFTYVY